MAMPTNLRHRAAIQQAALAQPQLTRAVVMGMLHPDPKQRARIDELSDLCEIAWLACSTQRGRVGGRDYLRKLNPAPQMARFRSALLRSLDQGARWATGER